MTDIPYKSIGFIGLGAMGKPMVTNLANKLPKDVQIHVYDIVQSAIDELSEAHPTTIKPATSAKDVAAKSVQRPSPPKPL